MSDVDRVVTHGVFSVDGQDFEVDNNIWMIGDGEEVIVVDAAHDHRPIRDAIGGRRAMAIVATHGHNDHINAAVALAEDTGAPILLHRDDIMLWHQVYPDRDPDRFLADEMVLEVGETRLMVLHTPGHTPGGCCLYDAAGATLFSGDTFFRGGPGATGRIFSNFPTIISSIRDRLLILPGSTRTLPGHGEATTIEEEAPHLDEWIERGF